MALTVGKVKVHFVLIEDFLISFRYKKTQLIGLNELALLQIKIED